MTGEPFQTQSVVCEGATDIDSILDWLSLPSPPLVARHLLRLCGNPTAQAPEIASVIGKDDALASELIRLANRVSTGAGIPVTHTVAAAVRLGPSRIKSLALGFEIARLIGGRLGGTFDFQSYWQGCVVRGCLARAVALRAHRPISGEAFLVGLLADLGVPILAAHNPPVYAGLLKRVGGCPQRLAVLEMQSFGLNHLHVARRLLERWKMPPLLADAIGRHHTRPPLHHTADRALGLWQIAYFVGALPVEIPRRWTLYDATLRDMLKLAFGIVGPAKSALIRQGEEEFRDIEEFFRPYMKKDVQAAKLFAQPAKQAELVRPLKRSAPSIA